jgi:hypothetical protein
MFGAVILACVVVCIVVIGNRPRVDARHGIPGGCV